MQPLLERLALEQYWDTHRKFGIIKIGKDAVYHVDFMRTLNIT